MTDVNDFINCLFEFSGGIFVWLNVLRLYQHKTVKGVSLLSFFFFATWGYWNLHYYTSLNQTWSFVAAAIAVAADSVWVMLAMRYRTKG